MIRFQMHIICRKRRRKISVFIIIGLIYIQIYRPHLFRKRSQCFIPPVDRFIIKYAAFPVQSSAHVHDPLDIDQGIRLQSPDLLYDLPVCIDEIIGISHTDLI